MDEGITFFRSHLGAIPLLSSTTAEVGGDRDETHYCLIPDPSEPNGYSLYRTRVLPDGVGPENDLPKARIFQIPAEGTGSHLTELLSKEIKEEHLKTADFDSPLANRLDAVANEIDRQSNLVSGGLLLIGGAIAIANPLLGVGIAAKSLLPGLGSKLSTHGIKHASDWLKSKNSKSLESDAEKMAQSKVRKLKPEIRINPVTQLLEKSIHSKENDFDPSLESASLFKDISTVSDIRIGALAILAVYEKTDESKLSNNSKNWIKELQDFI